MANDVTLSRWLVKHPYLVRTIIIAIVSLLVVTLLTIPFFSSTTTLRKKVVSRRKEAAEIAQKVTILSGLDQELLAQRVKILDKALPPRKDVVLYLSTIDGLSKELNLNFGGISLTPGDVTEASISATTTDKRTSAKTKVAGLSSLDTEVKIDGSRDNIYAFLREIEGSNPIMEIKNVQVTTKDENRLALSLNLGMLYAPADIAQVKGQISLFDAKEEAYFSELANFKGFETPIEFLQSTEGLGKSDLFEEFGN